MKKLLIATILLGSIGVFASQFEIMGGWSFFAPGVSNEQDYNILDAGDIVYDTTEDKFYGKTGSGNNWVEFGATATDSVKTPGATNPVLVSALVTSGSTITEEDDNFLSSCAKNSTGTYSCDFTGSYWDSTPHCWIQASANARFSAISSVSTSSVSLITLTASGLSDVDFYLFCKGEKQ